MAKNSTAAAGKWVDVGSGAGAPGIGLHLLLEQPFTLVEPKAKRVAFLRTVIGQLGLTDVEVRRARSDDLETGGWETAISRATLAPDSWLAEGTRVASKRVWVLLAKHAAPESAEWSVEADSAYALPLTKAERRAVCYVKRD